MELFEFHSNVHHINKALSRLKKEYGIVFCESQLPSLISKTQRKVIWMRDNLLDTAGNQDWVRESLVLETAVKVQNLISEGAAKKQYRIDPKTGAFLNFVQPENGDIDSVAARPDLYWRDDNGKTNDIVVPAALNDTDIENMQIDAEHLPADLGTGVYVGIDTPGGTASTISGKKGTAKARVAKMNKKGVVSTTTKTQTDVDSGEDKGAQPIFSKGGESSKYMMDVGPVISGDEDKEMKESVKPRNHILTLVESEIEKAQIVMAVHNEIVNKLQRDAEKIANMKIDVLGPIVDRIKAEHGLDAAEAFRDTISREIDQALDIVMQVKDRINTETLKLTGDVSSAPSIEQDLGAEEPMDSFEFEDEFTTDEPEIAAEPVPADREVKESRRLGLVVETIKGTQGKKYFGNVNEMRSWVMENQHKIARVKRIV